MIVAQLIETLAAGGAENLAVQIANSWAVRGHESHLVVLAGGGPFRDRVAPGVTLHELDQEPSNRPMAFRLPALLRTRGRLFELLSRHGVEALQTHLPMANFLGLAMAWGRVCRVYPTVHNNREFDYGDRSGPLREKLRKQAYRQMLKRCQRMIAVSEPVRESIIRELALPETWRDRFAVVPNGVPLPDPPDPDDRAKSRAALGVGPDEVLLVGVGRLTDQKNYRDLVEALRGFPSGLPAWRAMVAGEGHLRSDLENLVANADLGDRLSFPGHQSDVGAFLTAADVFCLPSKYEGLPLVLLEALAHGLPVAAYGIDGVTDVVTDGREALLAPPGQVNGLRDNLAQLVSDGALRTRLGAAGRQLVEHTYTFDRVMDRLEEVCAT